MNHGTGTGKTITALALAMKFISIYRKAAANGLGQIGSVFILGFSEEVFYRDLFRYPEFGFVTEEELVLKNKLQKKIFKTNSRKAANALFELMSKFKRRLSSGMGNGFFVFIGYKAFFTRLFAAADPKLDLHGFSEEQLLEKIKSNEIIPSANLLDKFQNSLLICDEIHKVYNNFEKNNWGTAIQYVLDNVPSLRALFLSATPLSNSPREIVDLMNLLLPPEDRIKEDDFFSEDGSLKPGALERIGVLSTGRVSFLIDTNMAYFPVRRIEGESIPQVPYLKFIKVPMEGLHLKTYLHVFANKAALPVEDVHLLDMVFPNPEDPNLGLYNAPQIRLLLSGANANWKAKHKITYEGDVAKGPWLSVDNLSTYSSKYCQLMKTILECIRNRCGKIFVYHNLVQTSGVQLLGEMFKENGLVEENGIPNDSSVCICGEIRKKHSKAGTKCPNASDPDSDQKFTPARFVIIHGSIDHHKIKSSIDKFNHPDNVRGSSFMILLGARKMQESYDLKAVREVMLVGRIDNIAQLKQIMGRAVRKNSHIGLPMADRTVRIRIFISVIPKQPGKSYEELRYVEKGQNYIKIQQIEQQLHKNAIDARTVRTLDQSASAHVQLIDEFEVLPFSVSYKINPRSTSLLYSRDEIDSLLSLVKRLFGVSLVWTYDDLWKAVQDPPLYTETSFTDEKRFIFCLSILMNKNVSPTQIIKIDGIDRVIVPLGEYYIAAPLYDNGPLLDYDCFYRSASKQESTQISINNFLQTYGSVSGYSAQRERFWAKWESIELEYMTMALCDFGLEFHRRFVEECIQRVFEKILKKNIKLDPFIVKMLIYYDSKGLLLWGHSLSLSHFKRYQKHLTLVNQPTELVKVPNVPKTRSDLATNNDFSWLTLEKESHLDQGTINRLVSAINQSLYKWRPDELQVRYQAMLDFYEGHIGPVESIPAHMLPVGHAVLQVPKFWYLYGNPEWVTDPEYHLYDVKFVENSMVLGYDDKIKTALHVHFKVRPPLEKRLKYRDVRHVERGGLCMTKNKEYILDLAFQLGLGSKEELLEQSSNLLCLKIRISLIYRELKERIAGSNIKWFYFFYEAQPKL